MVGKVDEFLRNCPCKINILEAVGGERVVKGAANLQTSCKMLVSILLKNCSQERENERIKKKEKYQKYKY
jgi:hypothetical protein